MSKSIILNKSPKIEFTFRDNGFHLMDGQTENNTDFYMYDDIRAIDVESAWFPKLAKWLRIFTWIFNGVPFFPDAESYKKAKLMIHFKQTKLGIWLTDSKMTKNAKRIKILLDEKIK